jgi:hypothetical protein
MFPSDIVTSDPGSSKQRNHRHAAKRFVKFLRMLATSPCQLSSAEILELWAQYIGDDETTLGLRNQTGSSQSAQLHAGGSVRVGKKNVHVGPRGFIEPALLRETIEERTTGRYPSHTLSTQHGVRATVGIDIMAKVEPAIPMGHDVKLTVGITGQGLWGKQWILEACGVRSILRTGGRVGEVRSGHTFETLQVPDARALIRFLNTRKQVDPKFGHDVRFTSFDGKYLVGLEAIEQALREMQAYPHTGQTRFEERVQLNPKGAQKINRVNDQIQNLLGGDIRAIHDEGLPHDWLERKYVEHVKRAAMPPPGSPLGKRLHKLYAQRLAIYENETNLIRWIDAIQTKSKVTTTGIPTPWSWSITNARTLPHVRTDLRGKEETAFAKEERAYTGSSKAERKRVVGDLKRSNETVSGGTPDRASERPRARKPFIQYPHADSDTSSLSSSNAVNAIHVPTGHSIDEATDFNAMQARILHAQRLPTNDHRPTPGRAQAFDGERSETDQVKRVSSQALNAKQLSLLREGSRK